MKTLGPLVTVERVVWAVAIVATLLLWRVGEARWVEAAQGRYGAFPEEGGGI